MKKYLKHAIIASNLAQKILLKYFTKINNFNVKKDAGFVTKADIESESCIKNYLFKKFPSSSFLAEESGNTGNTSLKWIIDPLDGTTNFYHGFPQFCISIALEINNEIVLALVNNPLSKDIYHSIKGSGAFKNKKQIFVSKTASLENALIGTGFAYMKGDELKNALKIFENFSNKCHGIRRPGSAVLDLCMIAEGIYDGFYEKTLNPWDLATGFLLIQEAGGKISNFEGKNFSVYNDEICASNSLIHEELLKIIRLT